MVGTIDKSFLARRQATAEAPPSAVGSTERVRKLHSLLHSAPHTLCLRRARAYTRVFAETEGEPAILRRAKALAQTLRDLPAQIYQGELLVGMPTCRMRAASFYPEVQAWLRRDIDTLPTREQDPFEVSSQQIDEVKKLLAYWQGETLFDLPPVIGSLAS